MAFDDRVAAMSGSIFRRPAARLAAALAAIALAVGAGVLIHVLLGLLSLRIAAAPGQDGARAASAMAQVFASDHPRVRVQLLPQPDLAAAAVALGRGESELAVVRSDAAGPDSQTLVILRRDAVLFVVPAHSKVEGVRDLAGRRVGLLSERVLDGRLLDRILRHYGIAPDSVHRTPIPSDGLLAAVRDRRHDAFFVVAPVDGPTWLPLFAALRRGAENPPKVVEIDEAAAIARDDPGLETLDVAKGTLQGSPPAPDDDVTTLSVSYRLAARSGMPDWLAGAITQEVLTRKPRLAALDGGLSGIEAPDTDDKAAALPIHSGAAAYLTGNLTSLSDQVQNGAYWLGLMASAAASLGAATVAIYRRVRPHRPPTRVTRLLELWLAARSAVAHELAGLEGELDGLMHDAIRAEAHGRTEVAEMRLVSLLGAQVRQTIDRRRAANL